MFIYSNPSQETCVWIARHFIARAAVSLYCRSRASASAVGM